MPSGRAAQRPHPVGRHRERAEAGLVEGAEAVVVRAAGLEEAVPPCGRAPVLRGNGGVLAAGIEQGVIVTILPDSGNRYLAESPWKLPNDRA